MGDIDDIDRDTNDRDAGGDAQRAPDRTPNPNPNTNPDRDRDRDLTIVDQAIFQLRRAWSKPPLTQRLSEYSGGKRIQLSNVMVVSAVFHLTEEAHKRGAEVTVGAVATRLDIDPSTASRLVTHAIDAGFVVRHPSPVDARRAHLELTPAGRRIRDTVAEQRRRYVDGLMRDWSDADRAAFARLLRRFSDAAAANPITAMGTEKIFESVNSVESGEDAEGDAAAASTSEAAETTETAESTDR
jgi:DNA-binding MarR family transcriptional regulator